MMDVNVQQHHAFEEGIREYSDYLSSVDEGQIEYEGPNSSE